MRGVGELPGASSGSFPAEKGASFAAEDPAVDAPSALRMELALLNQVRSALQLGLGVEGLRTLDQYSSRFPNGSLAAEASVADHGPTLDHDTAADTDLARDEDHVVRPGAGAET